MNYHNYARKPLPLSYTAQVMLVINSQGAGIISLSVLNSHLAQSFLSYAGFRSGVLLMLDN